MSDIPTFSNENPAYERVQDYLDLLIGRFTDSRLDQETYAALRQDLLNNPEYSGLAPRFLRKYRDVQALWTHAKSISDQWEPRRVYLREQFEPLLQYLEDGPQAFRASPVNEPVALGLSVLDEEHVHRYWVKAQERVSDDPEGAITAARTLLESTCKVILGYADGDEDDEHDLPKLYKRVSKSLNLSPSQHSEEAFKRILGGCTSVVEGLGSLRNKVGDAHGKGRGAVRPHSRHATLAVNLSGAMALFLVETWQARRATVGQQLDGGSD